MDKNSIIGILLIAIILIVWGVLNSPSKQERLESETAARVNDSIATAQAAVNTGSAKDTVSYAQPASQADSSELSDKLGIFAGVAAGNEKLFTIENDVIKLTVTSKGGKPYSAEIKDYLSFRQQPVILFDGDSTKFGLNFYHQSRHISTNELFFSAEGQENVIVSSGKDSLVIKLPVSEGRYIEYSYVLEPASYMVDFNIRLSGMNDVIDQSSTTLDLDWQIYVNQIEQRKQNENQYTTIYYRHYQDEVSFINPRSKKTVQEVNIPTKVEWVAFKNQFFSSILFAPDGFSNALLSYNDLPQDTLHLKNFNAALGLPYNHNNEETIKLRMYYGPNKFKLLKKYGDHEFQDIVSVGKGLIRWINQFIIIPIFDWLSRFISNYGIIILLLTLIIKIALLPLTYKSYLSQAKMKVLKPQLDELKNKYPKGKEMDLQQAQMALYKKAGVSPLGGCLPMLLQFPILFAMFRFFPTSIELRQEGFLWAKDLSTYDAIVSWSAHIPLISNTFGNHISLFTLLMTVSTIISMKMSDTSASSQQMPGMKTMMYIMPVMFMFILNNFSAGLTYYYFLTNVITIGQNYLFKQFVDDKEILKRMEEKKAKPVKKSKFQQRLEEMAKQQGYRAPKKK